MIGLGGAVRGGRRRGAALAAVALCALVGCGESERPQEATEQAPPERPAERAPEPEAAGTTVVVRSSEFGPMLFDERRQAIYIFERDARDVSRCYGECAEAWPPVLTEGRPQAGRGVREELLGTTKRRDGKTQVTYAGKPLYFYANEEPGEVRCHNVNLNGGFWWVVGPNGQRRPA